MIKNNNNKLSNLVSILNTKRTVSPVKEGLKIYYNKENLEILITLEKLGYLEIKRISREDMLNNVIKIIKLDSLVTFKEISKKSRKIYRKREDIEVDYINGLGEYIVRTSKGVMSGQEAWKKGLGGEILLSVF